MPETAASASLQSQKSPLGAAVLSLLVPGAGQFYAGARNAGAAILATSLGIAFLIQWMLENLRVGQVEAGVFTSSWLWFPFALFWAWNILDAYRRPLGRTGPRLVGFALPIFIIYAIAWQVTDVNLSRLVTRFNDVRIIFDALIHPDLFTRDTEQQAGSATIWVPCSEPPQTERPAPGLGFPVQLDRVCATVGDSLVFTGEGFIPGTTGNVYWLEYEGTNEIQVRSEGQPVILTVDENGRFRSQFLVPAFAGRDGLDPTNPIPQVVEARFVQEVGPYKPSENFGELVGKVEQVPAPEWMVNLGIVPPGSTVPRFVPGKIFETIALGLMATLISIVVAVPLSFFGAHNIVRTLSWTWREVLGVFAAIAVSLYLSTIVGSSQPGIPLLVQLILWAVLVSLLIWGIGSIGTKLPLAARQVWTALLGALVFTAAAFALALALGWLLTELATVNPAPEFGALVAFIVLILDLAARVAWIPGLVFGFVWGERQSNFGEVIYYLARALFNITRSIDTLIWAIIFVVWVGLGAFAGLLALSLHSIAAIAKLYSEEIEHIDPGPVEATTATGANLLKTIRFAVTPQIVPPFLAYSLLRWDINMRSATVVGFVSAAGIGFYIVEAIRKGGYEQYAAALWLVAIVVMIVDYLSSHWREQILRAETKVSTEPPVPFYRTRRGVIYIIVFVLIFIASWNLSQIDLSKLLEPGPTFGAVISDFVTIDTTQRVWDQIFRAMLVTIFQALLATTFGAIVAFPISFLAARNITGRSRATRWIYYTSRFIFNLTRSIEALLYVAIFVFWVGIGAFAGTLALSVTTFGLIGKLFSEAIENIEEGPVEAVTATGANRIQTIAYAMLPQIIPPFVSYLIYQWDINIRIATIIGFAGGGGVGLLFSAYTGQLQYHKAGAVILAIVLVVTTMDFASAKIRERLV